MDEYLSKPLKQNQLIQTILKCATLGGALLESSTEARLNRSENAQRAEESQLALPKRPLLEVRAATQQAEAVSPSLLTAESADPMEKVNTASARSCIVQ
jgi:osomolarity two-component system sensor histidine kinase NIK1